MHPLNAAQLLSLWDAGQSRHPIDRALLALALALPDQMREGLADHPVGWREGRLLALRNATFGPALEGFDRCPACGALMEFALDGDALLAHLPAPADDLRIEFAGQQWRLPTSRDQGALSLAADADSAVQQLLARCRLTSTGDGASPAALDSTHLAELERRMEAADPAANIRLDLDCRDCGEHWQALLDVGNWFWDEVGASARHLLESVHRLACAYGWREDEVLALSPARRAAYLDLIG
ncbi:hypothetical protein J5J83_04950 [Azoarcus sp. L1K30]|uniref:hypothetical protein n=1 Tax=Azoarcus sp. L1K30 TaxID=2820277 RepID=UPI001B839D2E|nr:hypothetical protein [Azoarcus sp. L1K30]MBR0565466.1 hypothetical protein [Azoarcus sp. L1K30]